MMTIKNAIVNEETVRALDTIFRMDINSAYVMKISRMVKSFSKLFQERLDAQRAITIKYTDVDKDGNPIVVTDEQGNIVPNAVRLTDPDKFNQEMNELMGADVNLDWEQIPFEELGIDKVKTIDFMNLEFLFL